MSVPAPHADGALVRRVRLRLLAWSGGTTLVVLLVLGLLLYAAVASSLAETATDQLRTRAQLIAASLERRQAAWAGPPGTLVAAIPSAPGVQVSGPFSGTVALVVGPGGTVFPGTLTGVTDDIEGVLVTGPGAAAEQTQTASLAGSSVRVFSLDVPRPEGTFRVHVIGDRREEEQTLRVLLAVLLGGGVVALLAALGAGWVYAERALVPIRDALRRQREFAADASHELRTPLAIVRGSVEHLRRNADRPVREVGTALEDLDAEVDRLGTLVNDLLLLARTDSGELDVTPLPLDLADVALDAASGLAGAAAERGTRLEVDAVPVELVGDAGRLRQLVRILVDNALTWTKPETTVRVGVREDGGEAVLSVDDAGPGIRPADLPRVFDRFWRAADAPPGGNGLGLTIAAWIAERHGGRIQASNRLGGGARFEVRLPRG